MHELRGAAEPPLDYLLDRMQHCDLVLIEGFKNGGFPKLEVWRAALGKPMLWPDWPGIVATASDTPVTTAATPLSGSGCTALALSDTASIADFVMSHAAAHRPPAQGITVCWCAPPTP